MLFFGFVGLAMRWLDMPVVPMLLALVLGGQLEEHLRCPHLVQGGYIHILFLTNQRRISARFRISIIWSLKSSRN